MRAWPILSLWKFLKNIKFGDLEQRDVIFMTKLNVSCPDWSELFDCVGRELSTTFLTQQHDVSDSCYIFERCEIAV